MIPKVIHQTWVGDPFRRPVKEMESWKRLNPSWEVKLWTEREIDDLLLVNRAQYDAFYARHIFNGCSDIARVEILFRYGGVYLDADCMALRPLDDELFQGDFFTVYEHEELYGDRIASGILGCVAGDAVIREHIRRIGRHVVTDQTMPFADVGQVVLTDVLREMQPGFKAAPACLFLPEHHSGNHPKRTGLEPYATHFWGTTNCLY